MADTITGKIARKYMAHYIDTSFGGGTASWYRIGEDLEEYTVDMNPDTELKKNILGNTTFEHNGYEPSASGDPFYARVGDPLFTQLQSIVDEQANDDSCKTSIVEVHLWESAGTGTPANSYVAYKQDCYVVPTSYGGDTSGYQIPFDVNYIGTRGKGKFAVSADGGTFTADE